MECERLSVVAMVSGWQRLPAEVHLACYLMGAGV